MRLRVLAGLGVLFVSAVPDRERVGPGPALRGPASPSSTRRRSSRPPPESSSSGGARRPSGKPWRGRLQRGREAASYGAGLVHLRLGHPLRLPTASGAATGTSVSPDAPPRGGASSAPPTPRPRASASPISRVRAAVTSAAASAGWATPRTRTGSTSTCSTPAWTPGDEAGARPPDRPRPRPGPADPLRPRRCRRRCSSAPAPAWRGKRGVVTKLSNHDDHMHVRIKPRRGGR